MGRSSVLGRKNVAGDKLVWRSRRPATNRYGYTDCLGRRGTAPIDFQMKTRTVVEWVSGESSETESLKLISVIESGGRTTTSIGFMRDGLWYRYGGNSAVIETGGIVVAWAPLPVFDGEVEPVHTQEGKGAREAMEALLDGGTVRRFGWPLGQKLEIPEEDLVANDWVILSAE